MMATESRASATSFCPFAIGRASRRPMAPKKLSISAGLRIEEVDKSRRRNAGTCQCSRQSRGCEYLRPPLAGRQLDESFAVYCCFRADRCWSASRAPRSAKMASKPRIRRKQPSSGSIGTVVQYFRMLKNKPQTWLGV